MKKLRHKVSINTDRSSGGRLISSKSLPVRGARHTRVAFDVLSPPGTDLIIQHLRGKQLLARERRPLAAGTSNLEIKSHPESSDIACSLEIAGRPIDGVRFSVDCGRRIEPVARHFIVIGAMKAGTTTLFELLKQHPALCPTFAEVPGVSFIKEINYFRDLYRKKHRPVHYDWRFPFEPATHAWTLDVSPAYAKWPGSRAVPARIASLGGKIKLAYLLREPVDRAESHLAHSLQFHGQRAKLQHCIRTSCYAMQLDKFTRHLPRKDILLLDFEELQKNPTLIQTRIYDFLGVERSFSRTVIHNTRDIEFRLNSQQRAEVAEAVRPDVQRLIRKYGFTPAEQWLRQAT